MGTAMLYIICQVVHCNMNVLNVISIIHHYKHTKNDFKQKRFISLYII